MWKYFIPIILLGLVACDSDDDDGGIIEIEPGVYHSQCDPSGPNSKHYILTIEANYNRTFDEKIFTGVTDCSNQGVVASVDSGSMSLSNVDLGGGVSYFIDSAEGGDATPYFFNGTILYTSNSKDISSTPAATVFADFIAAPIAEAELIFTKQP